MGRDEQPPEASVRRTTGNSRSDRPGPRRLPPESQSFEEVDLSAVESVKVARPLAPSVVREFSSPIAEDLASDPPRASAPRRERRPSEVSEGPAEPRARPEPRASPSRGEPAVSEERTRTERNASRVGADAPAGGEKPRPRPARERVPAASAIRAQSSSSDPRLGATLVGRYRLEKLIGRGGMGRVYRAIQLPLDRHVAVKVLSPDFQQKDPQFVRRFFLEAASAARLTHPNTITVFDYGESEGGELFIAMEYLPGRPLSRVIAAEGRFPAERVLHVAMQVCRALREAHGKGIIHRDLKPGNILIMEENEDGDFVKVLDFGLVKLFAPERLSDLDESSIRHVVMQGDAELTKAGMFLGSPKYMSPEQIQGRTLDPRTDIYALGVLMFHMATGRPPFTGGSSVDVIVRQVNETVPTFESLEVEAPELEAIVRRCLAKKADDRFASMNELLGHLKDLHRVLTGHSFTETGSLATDLSRLDSVLAGTRPEAAFDANGIVDPSGALMSEDVARIRRGSSLGWWVAGGALVLALGAAAYLIARPPGPGMAARRATSVAAGQPSRGRLAVELTSDPTGAEVFLDGVSLGQTPTRAEFPPDASEDREVEFLFRLEGYGDRVIDTRPGLSDAPVHVKLERRGNGKDSDYKANPY